MAMAFDSDAIPAEDEGPIINYAKREYLRERVRKELIPRCREIRDRRQPLELTWASFRKTWTMEHEDQGFLGRSDVYLPAANKVVETLVSQLVAATFPGDEFFSVEAEKFAWQKMAGDVKALEMQRVRAAKVRASGEAFYRQLLITGNSPARVHWASKTRKGKLRQKKYEDAARVLLDEGEPHEYTLFNGPMFSPLPSEDVYYWPETVSSLDDALIVFEAVSTTKRELLFAAKHLGRYLIDEVEKLGEERDDSKQRNDQLRLTAQGYYVESGSRMFGRTDIIHAFVEMDLDAEDEKEEDNVTCVCVTFTWSGAVLRIVEADSICPGRAHPFVLGRMGTIIGRIHGTGLVERIHPLQVLLNDQVNQAMDAAQFVMIPLVLSNPSAVVGTLPDLEIGAQFLVHDVANAVKFERPPVELIQAGSMLATQTMSWMQDFAGAPPVLQGGSTPGRAFKTATGVGTAQQNATLPLQQMVRLCEADVWEPMLQAFWLLDQRFADKEVLLEGGGLTLGDPRYFNPGDVYGDFKFRWLASTQSANQQVVAQQVQGLIQLLSNPAVVQSLATGPRPRRVDLGPLIERAIRSFGLRDVERILVDGTPPSDAVPSVEGAGQPSQGLQPNALNGAQGQDTSGQFGAQRMDANALAASFGQLGGPSGVLAMPNGEAPSPEGMPPFDLNEPPY